MLRRAPAARSRGGAQEHFYQRGHQGGLSHGAVSLIVAAATLALIVCAVAAALGWRWPGLAAALAVAALLLAFLGTRRPLAAAPMNRFSFPRGRGRIARDALDPVAPGIRCLAHDIVMAAFAFVAALYLRLGD